MQACKSQFYWLREKGYPNEPGSMLPTSLIAGCEPLDDNNHQATTYYN